MTSDLGFLTPDTLEYDPSKYPFCSKLYDPETTNGLRIQDVVENAIPYSESSLVDVFEVVDGKGSLYRNLELDEQEISNGLFGSRIGTSPEIRVFFATQDTSHRVPVSLTRLSFIRLLEESCVPPSFVEVFINNNGAQASFTSYLVDGITPEAFHIFIKLPMAPALNRAIYFRYNIESKATTCLVFGNFIEQLEQSLQQVFTGQITSNIRNSAEADPFLILSAIFAEYSSILEYERRRLDMLVREKESKTGITAHYYDKSLRATAAQYASLIKEFHICQGFLMFFERVVEYQVDCIEFLEVQHSTLNTLRSQAFALSHPGKSIPLSSHKVRDNLSLSASFSRNRVCQVRTLSRRMQIQLDVVGGLIAQNDSRTSISISELSSSIAISTKRDSEVMKSIAVLTMIFLPGTFVSTFFAMPFFHVAPASEVDSTDSLKLLVDARIWLYPAVTLPLTLFVFGAWWGWSWAWVRMRNARERRGLKLKGENGIGERRNSESGEEVVEGDLRDTQWKFD